MSLDKAYRVDQNKVDNGIPVEFPEAMNDDGTIPTFYLAYAGGPNEEYKAALAKRSRGFRSGTIPEKVATTILAHVYAEAVIKGWDNVYINEQKLEYNTNNCIQLLKDLPEFFSTIRERATEITGYLLTELNSVAKN